MLLRPLSPPLCPHHLCVLSSSTTAFDMLQQALGNVLETESEGEKLAFPFSTSVFNIANAVLFYAHNGRMDAAHDKLKGKQ